MANFEFQPDMEVKEQLHGDEQIETKRKEGYNKCKEEIIGIRNKYESLGNQKDDDHEGERKQCKRKLSAMAHEMSDAYGLGLNGDALLDVNDAGEIEMKYKTNRVGKREDRVTILISETMARRTIDTYDVIDGGYQYSFTGITKTKDFELKDQNFWNKQLQKLNGKQATAYAAMGYEDPRKLKKIEDDLYAAYA